MKIKRPTLCVTVLQVSTRHGGGFTLKGTGGIHVHSLAYFIFGTLSNTFEYIFGSDLLVPLRF